MTEAHLQAIIEASGENGQPPFTRDYLTRQLNQHAGHIHGGIAVRIVNQDYKEKTGNGYDDFEF